MARRLSPKPEAGAATAGTATIIAQVTALIEPVCEAEGMELVAVQFRNEHGGRILRLLLDRPGGVTLDDCVAISREAGDLLDVGLTVETGPYRLEVSSPGPDRPLVKRSDFERFSGQAARIRTREAQDGRRNYTGTIEGMDGNTVRLRLDDGIAMLDFDNIARAQLVPREPI